jgi:hypothetical protein
MQHFFGLIRHAAGSEDHPTASMFVQLYRLLSVYSLLRLPKRRFNSLAVPAVTQPIMLVPPVRHATKRQAAVARATECIDSFAAFLSDNEQSVDAVDVPVLEDLTATPKDNIVFYVAGYVLRHCKKVISCSECLSGLSGEHGNLPQAALLNIKLRGALQCPSKVLFLSLREAEDYISCHLANGADPEAFTELLEQVLPAFLPLRSHLCSLHCSSVCAEIAVYYIVTRLHWQVKQLNRTAKSAVDTKKHRKKAKLC